MFKSILLMLRLFRCSSRFLVVLMLWTLPLALYAEAITVVPDEIKGVTRVDAEGLIEAVATVDNLVLIDARIKTDRRHGLIENSLSLPDVDTNCESLSQIVPTLNTPVLFYCNGVKCGRSVNSARIAKACGYQSVYWFRGGFVEWREKGYPTVNN